MATSSPPKTTHRHRAGDFEPAVVWYAVVAAYVACVVGEALLTGGVWVSPLGPLLALFALPYALPASIFSLIPLYLWLRKRPVTVLTSSAFVFGGAVAGLLWGHSPFSLSPWRGETISRLVTPETPDTSYSLMPCPVVSAPSFSRCSPMTEWRVSLRRRGAGTGRSRAWRSLSASGAGSMLNAH